MADESIDVDNFENPDAKSISGGGGYVDDDIQIEDDDDDDDDDDDAPLLPSKGPVPPEPKAPILKKRPPVVVQPPAPKPGEYKLRAAGVSEELREFLVAKFRDDIPRWRLGGISKPAKSSNHLNIESIADEPSSVRLFRDGESTKQRRAEGLAADKKARLFRESYRGQRREIRQHKQGYTSFRERQLREWKMEIAPSTVAQRIAADRQACIEKRLQRGDTENADLDDMDLEDDQDMDTGGTDKDKNGGDDKTNGDGEKSGEPSISDLKKLVRSYSGQFDGRTAETKFAFMVVDESTKTVDVVPVGDCSMFVFRADQQGNALTTEEIEAMAKQIRSRREKDQRFLKFAATVQEKQSERDHKMGDRSVVNSNREIYNPGLSRGAAPMLVDDDDGAENFEYEKEFDNDDLLTVDKEEATKPQKEILVDPEKRNKDFQRLIKDEPEGLRDSSDSENESQEIEKEEDKESKDEKGKEVNKDAKKESEKDQIAKIEAKVSQLKSSPSPTLTLSPSPSTNSPATSGRRPPTPSGPSSRQAVGNTNTGGASPSPSTRRATPQMQDVAHLLPPSGTLPTEQHVRAVMKELLKDRTEMLFKDFCRVFERKTNEQKKNLIKTLQKMKVIKKNNAGDVVVARRSARPSPSP